ncbi:MAG: YheU family protein [Desulfuromonadaceae bacterium]|nr:YheU family protein [Desulfuromonadaceae bacterium]
MKQIEVTIEQEQQDDHAEEGVLVPLNRINPETLRKLVEEFVTREWSELADANHTFEEKIEQVLRQLKENKACVVFDLTTESFNIIPHEGKGDV